MVLRAKNHFLFRLQILGFFTAFCLHFAAFAQDVNPLIKKVKAKLDRVNDYVAEGKMKTDVAFIKAPVGDVRILYKRPDKFKLKRGNGIFLLPKGGVFININNIPGNGNYIAIASGESIVDGTKVKVLKLLPAVDNSDVVLTTLYIDEANLLIRKTSTTTKDNGTYEMEMTYGAYAQYGLPDKVIFYFNTKDFKLPKGVTMEFDSNNGETGTDKTQHKKGKIEIVYSSYVINKGVADEEFR